MTRTAAPTGTDVTLLTVHTPQVLLDGVFAALNTAAAAHGYRTVYVAVGGTPQVHLVQDTS